MIDIEYIEQWCIKAANDLKVAENELNIKSAEEPITDVICFHCQ